MDEDRLNRLFAEVALGREAAENELFAQLRPRLLAIAFARGVSGADRDDVVQECLAAVFVQLRGRQFRELSNPSTWVIGILSNKIVDHFRKKGRSDALVAAAFERESHPHAQLAKRDSEARLQVFDTLKRLTPIERFVLTGTEIAGLTYEEIATRLNCPMGTIASTKHRAIKKFRELLQRHGSSTRQLERGEDGDV